MEKEIKKRKIYIADGSEDDVLERYFNESDKWAIIGKSGNGQTVVNDVLSLKPDFLIMEVMLSGMDGFMVMEKLKSEMKANCPKIIFISNLSHSGFVSKAIKEGAGYFMVKPVMPQNLEERMLDLLNTKMENSSLANDKQLDEKISNIFISIGIPAHIKGYQFLREAVKLAVEEPEIIGSITKKLYPTIAEKFETSSSKVERGIRQCTEKLSISQDEIEEILRRIEDSICEMAGTSNTVTSQQVGEETLRQLYPVSRVAYVRFASVYRAFDDLDQFIEEIEKLASR